MTKTQLFRRILDAVMTSLSVLLMGGIFLFPSDAVHEILGTVLIALWILHNVLNRAFYKSLFRGKYNAVRIVMAAVNGALLAASVLLAVSGVMLSNRVFVFLGIERGMGFARTAHLAASHWYYILIALHFGLHAGAVFSGVKLNGTRRIAARCVVGALSLYGAVAFFVRGLWKYLFLTQEFFFFDLGRGFILFLIDYVSVFVLFSAVMAAVFGRLRRK